MKGPPGPWPSLSSARLMGGKETTNGEASKDAKPDWERSMGVPRVKTARSRRAPKDGHLDWGFEEGVPREAAGTGAGAAGGEGAEAPRPDRSTRAAWRRLTGAGVGLLSLVR